jgi:hypothetical protein
VWHRVSLLLVLTFVPVMVFLTPSPAQAQGISAATQAQGISAATQAQGISVCPPPSQTLIGVWGPSRLEVLNPCQAVSGTVTQTTPERDGDTHVLVRVDPQYVYLLTNNQPIPGNLVVEIMPRDYGHLPVPSAGDHLGLIGAWVYDRNHGWTELHPVWSESINNGPVYTSGPQYS